MNNKQGYISISHTAWCGMCPTWDTTPGTKAYCVKQFKTSGWTNTKQHGWLCPKCSQEKKK